MHLRGDQAPGAKARAAGREARKTTPRSGFAELRLPPGRDPVGIVAEQNETRLQDLVPVRIGRMSVSPFTYFRGTAGTMAYDLAWQRRTGATLTACGDAHIGNFGLYASPERNLVFDLNDFDEVEEAPWEWDVARLLTSIVLCGRENGVKESTILEIVHDAAARYRTTLAGLMQLPLTDRYYLTVDIDEFRGVLESTRRKKVGRDLAAVEKKARKRTSEQVVSKITTRSDERGLRIVDDPPLLVRMETAARNAGYDIDIDAIFDGYRKHLRSDIARIMEQYVVADAARRVVGVGSVGTRCGIVLLLGPDDETLVLQVKEAGPSVLTTYGGVPARPWHGAPDGPAAHAYRVISGQRVMQAQSDPFLGFEAGGDGRGYFWRQFRDMKGSIELSLLDQNSLDVYGMACAGLLARAHSQSPAAAFIVGYLGKGTAFDDGMAAWSIAYADQVEADYEAFTAAIKSGRLPCDTAAAR